jgi:hypothetical protein
MVGECLARKGKLTVIQLIHLTGLDRKRVLKALLVLILHHHVTYDTVPFKEDEEAVIATTAAIIHGRFNLPSVYILDMESVIRRLQYPNYIQCARKKFGIMVSLSLSTLDPFYIFRKCLIFDDI